MVKQVADQGNTLFNWHVPKHFTAKYPISMY